MKPILMAGLLTLAGLTQATAEVNISVNIGPPPYYGYGLRDVVYVERYVPAPDIPQVFAISSYARVSPYAVADRYRRGWGWDRIYGHYHVPTHVVYAPVYPGYYAAPRGKARGHYKKHRYDPYGWR